MTTEAKRPANGPSAGQVNVLLAIKDHAPGQYAIVMQKIAQCEAQLIEYRNEALRLAIHASIEQAKLDVAAASAVELDPPALSA